MHTGRFLFCLIWVSTFGLITPRLLSQNSSPYRTVHTLAQVPVRDTISGIGISVNEVMPRATHGDVKIRLLSSGNLTTPNRYEVEYLPDAEVIAPEELKEWLQDSLLHYSRYFFGEAGQPQGNQMTPDSTLSEDIKPLAD